MHQYPYEGGKINGRINHQTEETPTEKKFEWLEHELRPYLAILAEASDTILDQDVSHYPIFIVHQHLLDMGISLIDQATSQSKWSVNASSLEEFVTKQLILSEKITDFKKIYKDPRKHLCLFVLSELGATFIFISRK